VRSLRPDRPAAAPDGDRRDMRPLRASRFGYRMLGLRRGQARGMARSGRPARVWDLPSARPRLPLVRDLREDSLGRCMPAAARTTSAWTATSCPGPSAAGKCGNGRAISPPAGAWSALPARPGPQPNAPGAASAGRRPPAGPKGRSATRATTRRRASAPAAV